MPQRSATRNCWAARLPKDHRLRPDPAHASNHFATRLPGVDVDMLAKQAPVATCLAQLRTTGITVTCTARVQIARPSQRLVPCMTAPPPHRLWPAETLRKSTRCRNHGEPAGNMWKQLKCPTGQSYTRLSEFTQCRSSVQYPKACRSIAPDTLCTSLAYTLPLCPSPMRFCLATEDMPQVAITFSRQLLFPRTRPCDERPRRRHFEQRISHLSRDVLCFRYCK